VPQDLSRTVSLVGRDIEPAAVVSAMSAAVQRLRRMAVTLFVGDAALFDDRGGTGNDRYPTS